MLDRPSSPKRAMVMGAGFGGLALAIVSLLRHGAVEDRVDGG